MHSISAYSTFIQTTSTKSVSMKSPWHPRNLLLFPIQHTHFPITSRKHQKLQQTSDSRLSILHLSRTLFMIITVAASCPGFRISLIALMAATGTNQRRGMKSGASINLINYHYRMAPRLRRIGAKAETCLPIHGIVAPRWKLSLLVRCTTRRTTIPGISDFLKR